MEDVIDKSDRGGLLPGDEPSNCQKHNDKVEVLTKRMEQGFIKAVAVLIEEDTDMRSLMQYLLENAGFQVIALQGDSYLIERIGRFNPDIVLIDLQWPPSERLALISQLRESVTNGALPIIALVMDMAQEEESLRAGATAILRKPDDVRWLPDMIDLLMEQTLPPVGKQRVLI